MSKYTTELRYICESLAGLTESAGYNSLDTILTSARSQIFNFTYPIYDETHREDLEKKILRHYYTQEIGLETYGLWHLELDKKMNEIMPYYNELYRTADLEFNPIYDVNYTKTHTGTHAENATENHEESANGSNSRDVTSTETGNATDSGSGSSTDWTLNSDTPQGTINNVDLQSNAYLSNASKDTNESQSSSTRNTSRTVTSDEDTSYTDSKTGERANALQGEDEYTETMVGKVGTYSYAKMIKEYREQVLNIDLMIINELQDLFMLLW